MSCIKSQNQLVNTVIFPGATVKSSYSTKTFQHSNSKVKLLYIPYKTDICSNQSYIAAAPSYIPAILVIGSENQTGLFCIHFHGNACDIGQIELCAERESYCYNAHYLLVEYPRYGISDGHPCEKTLDELAKIVHAFVIKELQVHYSRIILFGRSIGTGPACSLASYLEKNNMPIAALILQSPYSSIADVTSDLLGCVSLCVMDRWQNWKYLIGKTKSVIRCPVLFIHADNDKIINYNHSKLMHEARVKLDLPSELFTQKSNNYMVKGHNYFDYEKDVVQPVKQFLNKNIPSNVTKTPIVLPRNEIDKFTIIPSSYCNKKTNINNMSRDIELIDDGNKKEQLAKKEVHSNNSTRDDVDSEYFGITDKFNMEVIAGWSTCCCVFCCEGCISLNCKMINHFYYLLSNDYPAFDYQSLKPRDGKHNSFFNLFNREAFEESPTRKNDDKIHSESPVHNPLIINEHSVSSSNSSVSSPPKGMTYVPG